MELVRDFSLPDPARTPYTIKMNLYPDGLSRVSAHRHGTSPRVRVHFVLFWV